MSDRSPLTLERLRTFVRVVERGSLSAVARDERVGQSSVTRRLAELEAAVGARLLHRTTRRLDLTEAGARLLEDARTILQLVDEASDRVRAGDAALAGLVRVSATAALGVRHVAPALFALQDLHPALRIDLSLTDARIDLVQEAADVAVRLGPLADSAMLLRSVGRSARILAAAPRYLESKAPIATPDDLAAHDVIRMRNVAGSDTLTLHGPRGELRRVPVAARLELDHGLAARAALVHGRGVAVAHHWLIDDLLAGGDVLRVLPDWQADPVALSLLIAPGRERVARVRATIDALVAALGAVPGID